MNDDKPRVALGCNSKRRRELLEEFLLGHDLDVVMVASVAEPELTRLSEEKADVILIDLDEQVECSPELLDQFMDQTMLPVLFNDGMQGHSGCTDADAVAWQFKLVKKLTLVTQHAKDRRTQAKWCHHDGPTDRSVATSDEEHIPALAVWVLGASVGGPQAVKLFLAELPAELPLAFILVQHIGSRFVSFLARQLDRVSAFSVVPARSGMRLSQQQVVVAPVDEGLLIASDGRIQLQFLPQLGLYRPSIDATMVHVAERFGNRAGAIVFTGMGDDGMHGCEAVAAHGGLVWAQDAESCFISSMPDHARATGRVSFSGSPAILAQRLVEHVAQTIKQSARV